MKRIAIYARVSTSDQTCDNQLRDLRDYCRARGWEQVTEYVDQGISGTRERRPALDGMMAEVKARRVDVVVVAAFDRFGRSVRHLVEALDCLRWAGAAIRQSLERYHSRIGEIERVGAKEGRCRDERAWSP